jgi:hypothetical protein
MVATGIRINHAYWLVVIAPQSRGICPLDLGLCWPLGLGLRPGAANMQLPRAGPRSSLEAWLHQMTPQEYRVRAKACGTLAKAAPEHMKESYEAVARELFALADQLERTGLVKPRHPEIVKRLPTQAVRQ